MTRLLQPDSLRAASPCAQNISPLAEDRDAILEHPVPQLSVRLAKANLVNLQVAAQGVPQLVRGGIQPLPRAREQGVGARQHPHQLRQMTLAVFHRLAEAAN